MWAVAPLFAFRLVRSRLKMEREIAEVLESLFRLFFEAAPNDPIERGNRGIDTRKQGWFLVQDLMKRVGCDSTLERPDA